MARSQFAFRREPGPFVIGTSVRTDATAAAVSELFHYHQSLFQQIGGVSATDIQRVARRYLDPEKMVVVAVGDRSRIEPALSAAVAPATRTPADVAGSGTAR